MQPVSLAFLWHQHQPYYPDDVTGENAMPWVRLHGTKDYYGMALHIKEVPEFRCTINLVPSLLLQIQQYTEQGRTDRHLEVSHMPADGLSRTDAEYLVDHFFMANVDNMIRPYSRYHELYVMRGLGKDSAENAVARFSERDLRDLQVWNNLTWFHPLAFETDSALRQFLEKGQSWTEDEKLWLLDKQLEVLRQVIPLHRELAEGGQLELTTSPFYHPILPLLWDKRSARQAMPGCQLPKHLDSYSEDAKRQLQRAIEYHEELFGVKPTGMWPSEGSVSHEIIAAIADVGIEWIATDEEILAESTNGWISRDEHGHMRHPEMLFRPWRVSDGDAQLQVVFRDHALSDLIGFHYQRSDPHAAAADLLGRIEGIGRAVDSHNAGRPALVPIILDGENCWEYYADGGVEFLRTLYREAAARDTINPVRVSDHVCAFPATDKIGHLYAGSWISHNFAIWIGHQEDVTAWELLHETRKFLQEAESSDKHPAESIANAWEEIFIAEGSDWFWWFGDDHSSAQDVLFDQLFRKHLQNVYELLGTRCPDSLQQPITRTEIRAIHTMPTGFLPVKIDGRRTYFEWISAGRYISGSERGTMTLVTEGVIHEIFFGFDSENLFVRIDTAKQAREDLKAIDELVLRFLEPEGYEVRITKLKSGQSLAKLCRKNRMVPKSQTKVAIDRVLELQIRFNDLKRKPDEPIHMYVETLADGQSIDRTPSEGALEFTVPSQDFEAVMWQV